MGLIRTVLALIILVILAHVGMVYFGVERATNNLTDAVYGLGELLEAPASIVINAIPLPAEQRGWIEEGGFYAYALGAAVVYLILYLLLGIGRRS
jgi:hypothetical protein